MIYMFIEVFECGESIPVVSFSCKSMVFIIIANEGQIGANGANANLNFCDFAIFWMMTWLVCSLEFFRKRNRFQVLFKLPEVCFNDLKASNNYVNQTRHQLHISGVLH